MNTFVCLFILLPQIRSENQNKETRDIPQDGITYIGLALGFDLAKTVRSLSCYCNTRNIPRSPFHLLASRAVRSPILKEGGAGPFWGHWKPSQASTDRVSSLKYPFQALIPWGEWPGNRRRRARGKVAE